MKFGLAPFIVLLLSLAPACFAHIVDEYLQATTLSLEKDRVTARVRLTPGLEVFLFQLDLIDGDGDGVVTDAEQRAYAERVLRDLSLAVDGKPLQLRLVSWSYPKIEDMREGRGEILLDLDAPLPPGGPTRKLVFENHHQSTIATYLANCLVPTDPAIHITAQNRNLEQSVYQVDYTQADGAGIAPPAAASGAGGTPEDASATHSLFATYFYHGVRHILTGYDHLLFVSALVLAAVTLWDLIKVVSAFTLAHTITLTLAALNLVHLPERVVEPLIAASIVFVALQNVFWPSRARGWSRLVAAFFFGLFHGLGFAGGLLDAMREMPNATVLLAILAFSLGVETGHQMVVLPLFGVLRAARHTQPDAVLRTRVSMAFQRIGSAGISVVGVYYLCLALTGRS